jgi:hypothetical protein
MGSVRALWKAHDDGPAVLVAAVEGYQVRDLQRGQLLDTAQGLILGYVPGAGAITESQKGDMRCLTAAVAPVRTGRGNGDRSGNRQRLVAEVKWDKEEFGAVAGQVLAHGRTLVAFSTTPSRLDIWVDGEKVDHVRTWRLLRQLEITGADKGPMYLIGLRGTGVTGWRLAPGAEKLRQMRLRPVRMPRLVRGGASALCCATLDGLGSFAVIGTAQGWVRVWDLASGRSAGHAFRAHHGPVAAVALMRPGPRKPPVVVTAGDGAELRLWPMPGTEAAGGQPLLSLNLEYPITALLAVEQVLLTGTKDGLSALTF